MTDPEQVETISDTTVDLPEVETDATDTAALSPEQLFERNLAAFATAAPDMHAVMVNHKPVSRLVYDENGDANVEYQDFSLYPEGSQKYVANQIDSYAAHSMRLTMSNIGDGSGLDLHSKEFHERMSEKFDQSGFRYAQKPFRDSSYFAIVLGIGLGGHIDTIVEKTQCRVLILVEPNFDLIYHSLSVYDWVKLFDTMRGRGAIRIFRENDITALSNLTRSLFRHYNPTGLDGTLVFQHYQSTIFQELTKGISDIMRTAVMGLGFYQDEVNMIGQTYKNLENGKARVIRRINDAPGLPAFIVATGPSLNNLIPFLKANQDKAVILCCGTSLHVLLKNGITPDFWVMAERNYAAHRVIRDAAEEYDISKIRFAGSTTVFPKTPEMFKEAIYFFRPGLSVAPLFSHADEQVVEVPDPLAANAGLAFATHVGFREVYFLGVDTGSKLKDRRHADGSWYEGEAEEDRPDKNMSLPVPGNFGGTVWSIPVYQWSRENLENLISFQRGRVFFNLGDGALIKGATPLHPKAAKIKAPSEDKETLVTRLVETCPYYTEHDFEQAWEKTAIIDELPGFCERLKKPLEDEQDCDDFHYIHQTAAILRPGEIDDPLGMLLRGTLFTSIIAFEYYANRAVDLDERRTMYDIFKQEYFTLLDALRDRAIEVFSGLEDGEPWEEEFVS